MKRILTTILMAVGITCPFVANLAAQGNQMTADVPFAFVTNNCSMPAGHYDLKQWGAAGSQFLLRAASGKGVFAQLGVRQEGKPNQPSLTFACYGKDCVLVKITPPGSEASYAASRESIEKNLHHTMGISSLVSVKLMVR